MSLFSGIWADHDSNDEGEDQRSGFGRGRHKQKDLAAPISFISGGFKQTEKDVSIAKVEESSRKVIYTGFIPILKSSYQELILYLMLGVPN